MICPQCSVKTQNKYISTACPKCRYQFVFAPNDPSKITDNLFIKKLKVISSDNNYYFTFKQLYYFVLGSKAIVHSQLLIVLSVILYLATLFLFLFNNKMAFITLPIAIFTTFLAIVIRASISLPYDLKKFEELVVNKWILFKGDIKNLIRDEEIKFNQPNFEDLKNYSFDALLITGDNEIANFLIKNDFHFKNKTAIVSQNKYPDHLFPYVIEQVKKNTSIPVFLVHNADILHIDMADKIKRNWFKDIDLKIYDLGLHAHHILKGKNKIISVKRNNFTLPSVDLSKLSKKEQDWYKTGQYTDLAVIPPIKLINLLEYGINTYKEKGHQEFEKVMASLFVVGLGLPRLTDKGEGFELEFGDDFG